MGSLISKLLNTLCNVLRRNSTTFERIERQSKTCDDSSDVNKSDSLLQQTLPTVTAKTRKPSMDVTRHNFVQTLREIEPVVAAAHFIAIDTEFTGLKRSDTKSLQALDTIDERYTKLRDQIACFNVIQFGLSCFKAVVDADGNAAEDAAKYECHSYNFYIFPQKSDKVNKSMGDRVFAVQSSSLQFLVNNGFDFNKLIVDGISYLNVAEEKSCIEAIKSQNEARQSNDKSSPAAGTSATSDEDKQFVTDVVDKVKQFIIDDNQTTLDMSPCNAFRRRLIYESLKGQDFNDSVEIKTVPVSQNSYDRYISITKVDKQEKERREEEAMIEAIGFAKVIQLIIKYEKPIVGHNVLLDLMHTFNQFIEPLPNDYKTFKESIHSLFPLVYDTKHIASSSVFKDILEITILSDLYERLKKSPFKEPEIELKNGKHLNGRTLHEAGYDSYLTGICFVGLAHHLGSLVNPNVKRFDQILLKEFQNKLQVTYTHDIHCLDLEGDEPVPNRDHVFHITFPKEWKTNELHHLFSAFGGASIHWINDTSAFCALRDSANIDKITKSLVKQSSTTYKVISYNDYLNKMKNSVKPDDSRHEAKRNAKARTSPQPTNPYKKSKLMANNRSDKKSKPKADKLFEEPTEWAE